MTSLTHLVFGGVLWMGMHGYERDRFSKVIKDGGTKLSEVARAPEAAGVIVAMRLFWLSE